MKVVIDDCRMERMDAYTDPLNDKIKRQAAEITRLLAENAELKGLNSAICDVCKHDEFLKETREVARAAGEEAAWELAQKIASMKTQEAADCFPEYNFPRSTNGLLNDYTYTEAAAKVAEWERQNEICVGDVVTFYGKCGLVTFIDHRIRGISENGHAFVARKEDCTKTGRHIDVDALLAQIGGESNE